MNNVFLEVINSVNLVNKKMNDNMKSLFSKYIKLLAVLLLSIAGVGQAWGQVNPMKLEIVMQNGTKKTYDMSAVRFITIKEDYAIAPNKDTIRMVDLGLPSGTLWADRNIGATSPISAGNYYAWGETKTKSNYSKTNYTYKNSVSEWYITNPEFDAASKNWGHAYVMPDSILFVELFDKTNTSCEVITDKSKKVIGYKVTSKKNGNSIFFPVTGIKDGNKLIFSSEYDARYWTNTQGGRGYYSQDSDAWALSFLKTNIPLYANPYMYFWNRYCGLPVRAVLKLRK